MGDSDDSDDSLGPPSQIPTRSHIPRSQIPPISDYGPRRRGRVQRRRRSSDSSELSDSDSDSEDSETGLNELCIADEDEVDDKSAVVPAECLFCDYKDDSAQNLVLVHFLQEHQLNINELIAKLRIGHLQYIKMVNFFRQLGNKPEALDIIKCVSAGRELPPWRSDEFLTVVNSDDQLLCVNLEDFVDSDDDEDLVQVTSGREDHSECTRVIDLMKDVIQRVVNDPKDESIKVSDNSPSKLNNDVDDNSGYFESYDDVEIHASMLNDFARTDAYRKALQDGELCRDISVLDLGCGTGILSLFAAQAGANHVCAIDQSNIIIETIDIIHENKLQDTIECVKGSVENLSHDKFDLIVSEWMGYFLLFEGMLNSFIYARDNFLKKDGILIPGQASMYIAGVSDTELCKTQLEMWDSVYGFKMTAMKRKAVRQSQVMLVSPDNVVTNSFEILKLNLYGCNPEDALIDRYFILKSKRSCELTAIVGFFDVILNTRTTSDIIKLGTGPFDTPTHWKQCVFQLPEKIQLQKGQIIRGNFKCVPNPENKRWLDVTIKIDYPKIRFTYTLN